MSEGAPAATAASVQPAEGALDANAQAWQEVLKHGTFPGGVLPGMQFAQASRGLGGRATGRTARRVLAAASLAGGAPT